jgi:hypothetical protein
MSKRDTVLFSKQAAFQQELLSRHAKVSQEIFLGFNIYKNRRNQFGAPKKLCACYTLCKSDSNRCFEANTFDLTEIEAASWKAIPNSMDDLQEEYEIWADCSRHYAKGDRIHANLCYDMIKNSKTERIRYVDAKFYFFVKENLFCSVYQAEPEIIEQFDIEYDLELDDIASSISSFEIYDRQKFRCCI